MEAWYQDVIAGTKDEESWSSGILRVKTTDKLNEYTGESNASYRCIHLDVVHPGLPFTTKSLPPHGITRASPPKLRNRERPSHRNSNASTRNSSPPPLPKSASLPLHATRLPPSTSGPIDLTSAQSPVLPPIPLSGSEEVRLGSPVLSRSPSTLFDQSPRITEVLRQISLSKASVTDLRTQIRDYELTALDSHQALQAEVESYRERKRKEDASRLELKSRTKTWEDSKRSAESSKRDAEKRLKAAESARDDANQRMEHLDKEIAQLQQRLLDDSATVQRSKEGSSESNQKITEALEHKKQEIKVAEDVIAALNLRARELEEKLTAQKDKLKVMKERAELRTQDRSFYPLNANSHHDSPVRWSPVSYAPESTNPVSAPITETIERSDVFPPAMGRGDMLTSPRPPNLALNRISNFSRPPIPIPENPGRSTMQSNGYSIFDEDLASLRPAQPVNTNFSPFEDADTMKHNSKVLPITPSPTTSSLIPSSLMTSLDNADHLSRSFQSDSDVFMDREWQRDASRGSSNGFYGYEGSNMCTSPISPVNGYDHDPFEVRIQPPRDRQWDRSSSQNPMDMQRVSFPLRTHSDPHAYAAEETEPMPIVTDKSGPRRWFSTSSKEKPKKGLNPDAKVFSLPRQQSPPAVVVAPSLGHISHPSFDALNPNGVMPSSTSTSNSFLRAFAPSPAEREALQRVLGGSTNASLERLPSLSDVGSIPSSPAHTHAAHVHQHSTRDTEKLLPSWLQSFPRVRKTNFSPWDDEEPVVGKNGEGGSGGPRKR